MGNLLILTQVAGLWLDKLSQVNTLIATAHKEGRDVSTAELDQLFALDDIASATGRQAIKDARANAAPK